MNNGVQISKLDLKCTNLYSKLFSQRKEFSHSLFDYL